MSYQKITTPDQGENITINADGSLNVPSNPIIPFIEGDGIGPDIWKASQPVFDAAVEKAYGGQRKIVWFEICAGEKALEVYGDDAWLPQDSLDAIENHVVAIKGPLSTPVGGGIRSLNVAIRQKLDLYACMRPVRYFDGVASPVKSPEQLNVVIFRENTEDVYAGLEWKEGSKEAEALIRHLNSGPAKSLGKTIFISSHILSELSSLCDAVTIVDRGKVRYTGGMSELLERANGGNGVFDLRLQASVTASAALCSSWRYVWAITWSSAPRWSSSRISTR